MTNVVWRVCIRQFLRIGTLNIILAAQFAHSQFEKYEIPEISDRGDLIRETNSILDELSGKKCTTDMIEKLFVLAFLKDFAIFVAEESEKENYYLDAIVAYGKLAYLYDQNDQITERDYFYEQASDIAGRVNPDYGNIEFVKRTASRVRIGCHIESEEN